MDKNTSEIDKTKMPKHIAVIMDGNGRWAKSKGKPRVFGHQNGVKAVRNIAKAAAELGVKHLTLYAFSTENWNRPALEVNALMSLLVMTLQKEVKTLNDNNIKLNAIGDLKHLPDKSYKALRKAIKDTESNTAMTLHIALNYSARWEITKAAKNIGSDIALGKISPDQIDSNLFEQYLETTDIPDPELLIRTSGELRISNYLLWQIAYSELYFTDVLWPDFEKQHLEEAIRSYQSRERRFGKTSEQISGS